MPPLAPRNCNFNMKKGRGRTSRIRRRKLCSSTSRGVNESHKPEFIELKKWLKDRKFEDTSLIPACFPETVSKSHSPGFSWTDSSRGDQSRRE
uniref:SET domain containing 4 n=1 Tax=Molossus molossus TaxID=27622 RepID=A0A7J8I2Y4_MOLMO|nr:SET domain containing 4 [Molossus molossus]